MYLPIVIRGGRMAPNCAVPY